MGGHDGNGVHDRNEGDDGDDGWWEQAADGLLPRAHQLQLVQQLEDTVNNWPQTQATDYSPTAFIDCLHLLTHFHSFIHVS